MASPEILAPPEPVTEIFVWERLVAKQWWLIGQDEHRILLVAPDALFNATQLAPEATIERFAVPETALQRWAIKTLVEIWQRQDDGQS